MNKKERRELKEPFKANIISTKWSTQQYNVHVEAQDPCVFLEICANIIKALKERGCNSEVLLGDLPVMQESHDESAEVEKDA